MFERGGAGLLQWVEILARLRSAPNYAKIMDWWGGAPELAAIVCMRWYGSVNP